MGRVGKVYRDLIDEHGWDMSPRLSLVEVIAVSRYAHVLHAITSHATLCRSQHPEFEFGRSMLRVDFAEGRFIYRYRESPYFRKEWKKECARDEGFATFEHVMSGKMVLRMS